MADQEQPPVCCEGKPASYVCVCGCHAVTVPEAARQLIARWRKWADEMDKAAKGTWVAAPVQRICAAELEDALSSGVKMGDLARYVEYSKRQIKSGPANEAMIRAMGLIDYLAGLAALPAAQPEQPPVPAGERREAVDETSAWFRNLNEGVRQLVFEQASRKTRQHLLAAIDEAIDRLRAALPAARPEPPAAEPTIEQAFKAGYHCTWEGGRYYFDPTFKPGDPDGAYRAWRAAVHAQEGPRDE